MKNSKHLGLVLIFVAIMLSAACGAKIVRGAAPVVRMNELSHDGSTISLLLSMRNINGVAMEIVNIDVSLSVEQGVLFTYNGPAETNIVANGTETWTVEVEESDLSRRLLNELQNGKIKSLPYTLKGSIISVDDGKLRFEHDGHIYPMPGRPGYFR